MKVLNIIEAAYRGTLEEQDDTIVWLLRAMKGADANIDALLTGNAVNYVVRAQDASGLKFGNVVQTQPPQLAHDLASLKDKGARVYVVDDALRGRGIANEELIGGIELLPRGRMAALFADYDQIWHW